MKFTASINRQNYEQMQRASWSPKRFEFEVTELDWPENELNQSIGYLQKPVFDSIESLFEEIKIEFGVRKIYDLEGGNYAINLK